jgi:CheY-like chemotaxis protein
MGNASLLLDEVPATAADRVGRIVSGAERAADLTRQLLAYAGRGRFMVRELDISEIVQGTADLLRLSIPKNVELEFNLQPNLPRISADAGQLQQLLMNLTSNASEATEGRPYGRVIVSTRACEVDRPFVDELGEEIAPARYICLEVADNGTGMDEETRKKIFDPFFTTKFTGRGLGLAAVSGIMRSQRGGIRIDTAPGKGTTFRLFFPAVEQPERREPPRKNAVLVVDDEEVVREFITAALRRAGYEAIPAANGKEALERWAEEQDRIALVVMDVVMPVMGGGELLTAFQRAQPDLKVLLTSGYNETEARRMCGECNVAGFIQKPYSARKLVDAVKSAIGEPGSPP